MLKVMAEFKGIKCNGTVLDADVIPVAVAVLLTCHVYGFL